MTNKVKNKKMSKIETKMCGIIQYYYPKEQKQSRLWEIVCDTLDIDYDDQEMGEYFEEIIKEYK